MRFDKVTESLKVGTFLRHSVQQLHNLASVKYMTQSIRCVSGSANSARWHQFSNLTKIAVEVKGQDHMSPTSNDRREAAAPTVKC